MARRISTLPLALAALVATSGCVGRLGARDEAPDAAPPPPAFVPAEPTLQRLTLEQYRNSVHDLLGSDVTIASDLEVDTPLHGFSTVGGSALTIGPHAAEQYESAALDAAHQVFADDTRRRARVNCVPSDAGDACVRAYVATFGRRAFRRALAADEVDRWMHVVGAVTTTFGDVWAGLEYATAGMLQSPNFLFRVALGGPDAVASHAAWRPLTGYETAARLSYFLWNSTPDDALLDAAGRGDLATTAGLRGQALRLILHPRAHAAVGNFFDEYFKLDQLDTLPRDPAVFPLFTPTLGASMHGEISRAIEDTIFGRNADLRSLYVTQSTYVNAELAALYGLPAPASHDPSVFARAQWPAAGPRGGLLTMAGILAANAHETTTSPVRRGRFIREYLLCQDVPPPPAGVNTTLPDPPAGVRQTLRQRLEATHLTPPQCGGCHQLMDPLGFGLESFDAIGAYRQTDNGLPVDPSGELDGRPFADARALGEALHDDPRTGPCIARQVYRYATAQLERREDQAVLDALADAFARGGYRFSELLLDVVTSDGFRYVADPPRIFAAQHPHADLGAAP